MDDAIAAISKQIDKLEKMKVPCVVALHYKGQLKVHGSSKARTVVEDHATELKKALEEDVLKLVKSGIVDTSPTQGFRMVTGRDILPKLSAKINLLKAKETLAYLRIMIVFDYHKRTGKKETQIKYRDPSWPRETRIQCRHTCRR